MPLLSVSLFIYFLVDKPSVLARGFLRFKEMEMRNSVNCFSLGILCRAYLCFLLRVEGCCVSHVFDCAQAEEQAAGREVGGMYANGQ